MLRGNDEAEIEEINGGEVEELDAKFPDIPAREKVPEPPAVSFTRPTLPDSSPVVKSSGSKSLAVGEMRGMGMAMTLGTSLVSSIIAGVVLGWLLDRFLIKNTTPWGLIGGFFLGAISGFVNLIRTANQINEAEEKQQKKKEERKK